MAEFKVEKGSSPSGILFSDRVDFARDSKLAVVDVNSDILLFQTRKFESSRHSVGCTGFEDINPWRS